jgi:hypothetical protein
MRSLLALCLTLASLAAACQDEPPVPEPVLSRCTGSQATAGLSEPARSVTFYGDLLPILSSTATGAVHKCTTCHAHYGKPEGLNTVPELESVVQALSTGRMPRGGDFVPAEQIELFRMWRDQGFPAGAPVNPVADQPVSPIGNQQGNTCA